MENNIEEQEEKIYSVLKELRKGDDSDRSLAFDCTCILGDESTPEPFKSRLDRVEKLIIEYLKNKNSNN